MSLDAVTVLAKAAAARTKMGELCMMLIDVWVVHGWLLVVSVAFWILIYGLSLERGKQKGLV